MLSFKSMTDTVFRVNDIFQLTEDDRYLSYLPLSHGMERWLGECLPFVTGMQIFYTEGLSTFSRDLASCMPTFFVSVPRLWTKFQQGVFKHMKPEKLDKLLKLPIVNRHYKKKVLTMLGLQCVRFAISGSAPLPPDLLAWYNTLGLSLLEGYGMTENFNCKHNFFITRFWSTHLPWTSILLCNPPDSHVNVPGKERFGTVGFPQVGVKQRIAEDGEIQITSPGMMMGYYKNEEATKGSFTADGWLRTGDKGELDGIGRLKITGRTKEIFKTSKGKYVAPAPIESKFISHPLIEMACVGGSGQPAAHIIVLLGDEAKKLVKQGGDAKVEIQNEMKSLLLRVNHGLDEHERLQFVAVVNEEWLPDNGFVTPTNKIKRAMIEEAHAAFLDEWYSSKNKVIWHKFRDRRSSLSSLVRSSVSSLETMGRSMRSLSVKRSTKGQQNISEKDMRKLHVVAKCSEFRESLRDLRR